MNSFQKKLIIVLAGLAASLAILAFVLFGSYTELKSIANTYKANLDSTAKWRYVDSSRSHPQTRIEAAKIALDQAKFEIDSLFAADTTDRPKHWDAFRDALGVSDSIVGAELLGPNDTVPYPQHW